MESAAGDHVIYFPIGTSRSLLKWRQSTTASAGRRFLLGSAVSLFLGETNFISNHGSKKKLAKHHAPIWFLSIGKMNNLSSYFCSRRSILDDGSNFIFQLLYNKAAAAYIKRDVEKETNGTIILWQLLCWLLTFFAGWFFCSSANTDVKTGRVNVTLVQWQPFPGWVIGSHNWILNETTGSFSMRENDGSKNWRVFLLARYQLRTCTDCSIWMRACLQERLPSSIKA